MEPTALRQPLSELSCNVPLQDENVCVERGMKRNGNGMVHIRHQFSEASSQLDKLRADMGVMQEFVRVTIAQNKAQRTRKTKSGPGTPQRLNLTRPTPGDAERTHVKLTKARAELAHKESVIEAQLQKCAEHETTIAELRLAIAAQREEKPCEEETKLHELMNELAKKDDETVSHCQQCQEYEATIAELRAFMEDVRRTNHSKEVDLQNELQNIKDLYEVQCRKCEEEQGAAAELRLSLADRDGVTEGLLNELRELGERDRASQVHAIKCAELEAMITQMRQHEPTEAENREQEVGQLRDELSRKSEVIAEQLQILNEYQTELRGVRDEQAALMAESQAAIFELSARLEASQSADAEIFESSLAEIRLSHKAECEEQVLRFKAELEAQHQRLEEVRLHTPEASQQTEDLQQRVLELEALLRSQEAAFSKLQQETVQSQGQDHEATITELRLANQVASEQALQATAELEVQTAKMIELQRQLDAETHLRLAASEQVLQPIVEIEAQTTQMSELQCQHAEAIREAQEANQNAEGLQHRVQELEAQLRLQEETLVGQQKAQDHELKSQEYEATVAELRLAHQAASEQVLQARAELQVQTSQVTELQRQLDVETQLRMTQASEVLPTCSQDPSQKEEDLQRRVQELEAQLRLQEQAPVGNARDHELKSQEYETIIAELRLAHQTASEQVLQARAEIDAQLAQMSELQRKLDAETQPRLAQAIQETAVCSQGLSQEPEDLQHRVKELEAPLSLAQPIQEPAVCLQELSQGPDLEQRVNELEAPLRLQEETFIENTQNLEVNSQESETTLADLRSEKAVESVEVDEPKPADTTMCPAEGFPFNEKLLSFPRTVSKRKRSDDLADFDPIGEEVAESPPASSLPVAVASPFSSIPFSSASPSSTCHLPPSAEMFSPSLFSPTLVSNNTATLPTSSDCDLTTAPPLPTLDFGIANTTTSVSFEDFLFSSSSSSSSSTLPLLTVETSSCSSLLASPSSSSSPSNSLATSSTCSSPSSTNSLSSSVVVPVEFTDCQPAPFSAPVVEPIQPAPLQSVSFEFPISTPPTPTPSSIPPPPSISAQHSVFPPTPLRSANSLPRSLLVPPSPSTRLLRPTSRTVPPPPPRVIVETDKEKIQAQKKAAEEYAFKPRRSLAQEGVSAEPLDNTGSFPGDALRNAFGISKEEFEDAESRLSADLGEGLEEPTEDNITRRPRKWIAPFKSAAVEATPKKAVVVQSSIPKCRVKKPGEEDFDDVLKVSEIKIAEVAVDTNQAKLLKAEVKRVREVLKDTTKDWQLRVKALIHLSDMMTNEGLTTIPGWQDEALALQPMLSAQLQDLRSGVITVACKALIVMAQLMGESFDEHMCFFLPILFKSLYVTIKVISVSADQCMQALLARCHSAKYVPQLVAGSSDAHSITRAKCTQYLGMFLAQSSSQPFPEVVRQAHCSRVSLVITNNMGDSDKDVRAATRGLFEAFEAKFPALTQKIFEEFPTQTQKAILADRQQKTDDKNGKKRKSEAFVKLAH